jgi:hypothetical protein
MYAYAGEIQTHFFNATPYQEVNGRQKGLSTWIKVE